MNADTSPTNFANGTLTGGTWSVGPNSTMRLNLGAIGIVTNAARIVLDGANSNFYRGPTGTNDAFAGFTTNATSGNFALENGRQFTTAGPFRNDGTVRVGQGSLFVTPGTYTQPAGRTVLDRGILYATLTDAQGGTLEGSGYLLGDVRNASRIQIGGAGTAGGLYIFGNYTQTATGNLDIEIGGPALQDQHDFLYADGIATLAGTLNVSLINNYRPALNDIFFFLLGVGGIAGNFTSINGFDLGGNRAFYPIAVGTGYYLLTSRPLFAPTVHTAAGPAPYAVQPGDYNTDGVHDVAVANRSGNSVTVLLGLGTGSFLPVGSFAAGTEPVAVAAGDFNRDGALDLVTASFTGQALYVLLGNGDGTFRNPVAYGQGLRHVRVITADFNRDGFLDLASTNNSPDNATSVLLGNGDGTFRIPSRVAAGFDPSSLTAADFNGDTLLDLAVSNAANGTLSVLAGTGDGTFRPAVSYAVGSTPQTPAAADFNFDGALDLVVAYLGGNVGVLLNNGDGTFGSSTTYATGGESWTVSVADFNFDGVPDVAVPLRNTNRVSVLLGHWDGTLRAPMTFTVGSDARWLAVSDFNLDGLPDLVSANTTSENVSVLLNAIFGGSAPGGAPGGGGAPGNGFPWGGPADVVRVLGMPSPHLPFTAGADGIVMSSSPSARSVPPEPAAEPLGSGSRETAHAWTRWDYRSDHPPRDDADSAWTAVTEPFPSRPRGKGRHGADSAPSSSC